MTDDLLRLEGVGMKFGGVVALRSVELAIKKGDRWAIIGPNGSGKTTLLNIISGVYRPTHGAVVSGGVDLARTAMWSRSRVGIRRTFQHPQLAEELTLVENVMLGAVHPTRNTLRALLPRRGEEAELQTRARELLLACGCGAYADRLPDEVPYGVQRLAELARAMLADPDLLLLDEPAAGLSPPERAEVMDYLGAVLSAKPAMAIAVIEHELGFVRSISDKVLALDFGSVIDSGPTSDVLSGDAVMKAFLGTGIES